MKMDEKRNNVGKVLYIVPSRGFFSSGYRGRVMHALGIAEGLADLGYDVQIIGGVSLAGFKNDLPENVELVEVAELSGVVGLIKWWASIIGLARGLAKSHDYEFVIIRYVVSSFVITLLVAFLFRGRGRTVLEVNSFGYHMTEKLGRVLNGVISRLDLFLANKFDLVYFVSRTMLVDKRNRFLRSKSVCIPNGATRKEIRFNSDGRNPPRLVYIGTLMPYWDFEILFESLSEVRRCLGVDVVFVGDGPQRELIESSDLQTGGKLITGSFSRNDLGKIVFQDSDILLLPPKTRLDMKLTGGLSTKVFDYMAMGMPILACVEGELSQILEDGTNCLHYDSGDVGSFIGKVKELLQDPPLRADIGRRARRDFLCRFSWRARMGSLVEAIYE